MIKINLLPPGINRAKQIKIAVGVVGVLVAAEVAGLLWYRTLPLKEQAELNTRRDNIQQQLTALQSVGTESGTFLAKEAALAPKFDFFTNMQAYNRAYPDLYERTARYTYAEATLLNMEASTNQMKFDAYVTQPRDVGFLVMGLSRHPDFVGLPVVTGVPGYNAAEAAARRQALANEGQEAAPTTIIGGYGTPGGGVSGDLGLGTPGIGGGGNGPGGGISPTGIPGGGGGNGPGGGMGGGLSPATPGAAGLPGAGGNGPGGGLSPAMPGAAGLPGGETGAGPGGGSGAGGSGGGLASLRLDGARRSPRGFTVTVSATLKNPVTRPSYGTSDSQLGGSGGGGGFGGGFGGGGFTMPGGGAGNGPGGGFGGGASNGPR